MGKKSRNKERARTLAAEKRSIRPDEYYSYGPVEIARFGKFVVLRNNMQKEQFEKMQARLANHFTEVCQEIDEKILRIIEIVKSLPPDELLKRSHWEMAAHHINMKSEIDANEEDILSLRMVDYIQSIIAAVDPDEVNQTEITEEKWQELKKLVSDLFTQLNGEYQICRTAVSRRDNPAHDKDFEEYYYKAQMYWSNVRGHRYLVHELPFYREVLTPHDDVLKELFGIDVDSLLDALQKIQDSLTLGIGKTMSDLHEFQQTTVSKLEEKVKGIENIQENELSNLMAQVIEENNWVKWQENVVGRLHGLDLFDLQKITSLPKVLLDELSWRPGQDVKFFEEGEYKGWPLRIWPVFKRPFIALNDRYYCFELYSLFDNFYRVIQRVIIQKKPEYSSIWNKRQQEISELIPIRLFNKLLPAAKVYHSVYYRWYIGDHNNKQWCETDVLLIYQDHLIIIEVKAGAFTYTSPATDFPSHIESLKNLVFKPAEQGKRFLEYLESEDEVTLYDSDHNEIGKISRKEFEHINICAVTLDPFTELAAQVQHLNKIGVHVGATPIWSISIDDLRVYADLFDNPLVFLHFVEQRRRAFQSELIKTEDELDHLGLYLKHNVYTQFVQDIHVDGPITWNGYRLDIDRYFTEKLHDPNVTCTLKQATPERLKEIIKLLRDKNTPGCRKVSSMLLDCGGEWRDLITSGDKVLSEQSRSGRAKPLSTYGDVKITVFYWQRGVLERDKELALEHAQTAMLVTQDNERLLLELTYDSLGTLVDINFDILHIENLSGETLERLRTKAEILRKRRIDKALENCGKIGRNKQCPCGSGRKYKKCCLLRIS